MGQRHAIASGAWSSPATWNGGTTLPSATDDVYANNKTITVNQDVAVRSLNNIIGEVAVVGGTFTTTGTRTITLQRLDVGNYTGFGAPGTILTIPSGIVTLNVTNSPISGDINFQTTPCFAVNVSGPATAVINASIIGGSKDAAVGVLVSGSDASVTVNGTIRGGTGDGCRGLHVYGNRVVLVVNGEILAGDWVRAHGVEFDSYDGGQATVHGDITGGRIDQAFGFFVRTGVVRVDGTLRWGAGSAPVSGAEGGTVMFMRAGEIAVEAPSDDDWPAATGAPITVGADPFPSSGIIWPPSALTPTA